MKRRNFLLTSLFAFPIGAFARLKGFIRVGKGFKVGAGKDRFNREIKFGGDSDRKGGSPLHIHHEQDEIFYVVQGKFRFQVGDEKFELSAGDCLFAPRKVPHAFVHIRDEKSKMMPLFQPAGKMEAFFHEFGKFTSRSSPEVLKKLFSDHRHGGRWAPIAY